MHAVRIARIAGIEVRLHPLMVVLVLLVALDSLAPGGPGLVSGLTWLAMVFTCVLVHELAHSLEAQRRSVPVKGIVLLPIGGVSQMQQLPHRPSDELAIAAAGPLASAAIGVAAAWLSVSTGGGLLPVDLDGGSLLHRLAWVNLLLAGFNLLPAFPLDGGRLLRAALARRWSLPQATAWAASAGRAMAVAMGVVGLLFSFWLVILAVFVYLGASAEEEATRTHVLLHGRRVDQAMRPHPVSLLAADRVADTAASLSLSGQAELPVVSDEGRYVGMTTADALGGSHPWSLVADHTVPVRSVSPGDDLEEAAARLTEGRWQSVAVVEHDRVVGLLGLDDVAALLSRARA